MWKCSDSSNSFAYVLICNYRDGEYNGVAAWMVYDLDDVTSVSFGPVGEIVPGNYIPWNMERKQGVCA